MAQQRIEISIAKVRIASIAGAAAASGVLALFLLGSRGKSLVLPGPLASPHAVLEENCDMCHSSTLDAVQHPLSGWVTSDLDLAQSRLCLECHALGKQPLTPHGWSRDEAKQHRFQLGQDGQVASFRDSAVPLSARGHVACSTCHREHRGRSSELATLSDQQCQTCHARTLEGFPHGHPEFSSYPYDQRTGIHFDHLAHIQRHFRSDLQKHAPARCTDCHIPDGDGKKMVLGGFEKTCMACHGAAIAGAAQLDGAGLSVLTFPALDTLSLEKRDIAIGAWPADASEVETEMAPIASFLLGKTEREREDLERFSAIDRLDLSFAAEDDLGVVTRVAWNLKRLYVRLAAEGHTGLIGLIEERLSRPLQERERGDLIGGLPGELLTTALDAWAFRGDSELSQLAQGMPPKATMSASTGRIVEDPKRESFVSQGGWYLQHSDFSLRYRPNGHADPFLRAWLDVTAESGASEFDQLSSATAQGACAKCHGIEVSDGGAPRMQWHAREHERDLLHFSHRPHLTPDDITNCSTCHVLKKTSDDYSSAFEQRDPLIFSSNFKTMATATCGECHSPEATDSTCMLCHSYHVNLPAPRVQVPSLNELYKQIAGN